MGSQPRGISASRGASILGMSAWSTPLETWQRIQEEREPGYNAARGLVMPEDKIGAPLRWGTAFEDAVVDLASNARGLHIGLREVFYEHEMLTCHIDGWYLGPGGSSSTLCELHEGKTTNARTFWEKWGDPGTDRIPREYQIQTQHQMLCTGAGEAIVSVLVFPSMPDEWEKMGWIAERDSVSGTYWLVKRDEAGELLTHQAPSLWANTLAEMGYFHQYRVPANPRLQALMLSHYREWWQAHVLGEIPPKPRTYADVKRLTPEPRGTIIADEDLARWIAEHRQIGEESAAAAKSRDALKVRMIAHAATLAATQDEESADKWVIRDSAGKKLAQYDGKTFR